MTLNILRFYTIIRNITQIIYLSHSSLSTTYTLWICVSEYKLSYVAIFPYPIWLFKLMHGLSKTCVTSSEHS